MCNMNDEITTVYDYTLQDGNPNANDVRTNLNSLLLIKLLYHMTESEINFYIKEPYPLQLINLKCINE